MEQLFEAKKKVDDLQLPDWILNRTLEEDSDQDGDPIVRVFLDVEQDFDPRQFESELGRVEKNVRDAVRDAGVNLWVIVSVRSATEDE